MPWRSAPHPMPLTIAHSRHRGPRLHTRSMPGFLPALPALAQDEHDVAHVDDGGETLTEDDHRLTLHQPIEQRHQPAADREHPEREWHHALAGALARDPLHQKAEREQKLRAQAEHEPEVELVDEGLLKISPEVGSDLDEHQRISVTCGTRFRRRISHQTPARSRIPIHSRSHMP